MSAAPPQFDAPFTLGGQLEARANHAEVSSRVALCQGDRSWTYRQLRDESVRYAHFLLRRIGQIDDARPGHVAMILENHLELMALYGACGYAGLTLFGVNTGLRGETLAGVLNQSRARLLVVDERAYERVDQVRDQLDTIPAENILVLPTAGGKGLEASQLLDECISSEIAKPGESLDAPDRDVAPDTNLMVIYTSGTTGLPKGINNNHMKLLGIGAVVSGRVGLSPDDCGYACMPLFHSNAMFLGFQPTFHVSGRLAMRERFSASQFVPDVFRHGVTYWNYVGEPVHYILGAIRSEHGGDEEKIRVEVTEHPDNHLRWALGNGASPPDIDAFTRWMGIEDMFELYGSTEAAISTFRQKGDPRGSVGEISDEAVKILDEKGSVCPPADLDSDGKIVNYAEAVGEICRVAPDTALFQGYFDNDSANSSKYRDGVYHSGDLGHVLEHEGKRFLFFDGRTDDWIRKDGENFSAAQVARTIQEHPDVVLAAAYGVPCVVSDELVMVALKLSEGAEFDPKAFFEYCDHQVKHGSMDKKWVPDFVRLVDEFEYTQTQKILVRHLKAVHFDRRRLPDEAIFWRRRQDDSYLPFGRDDFDALREEFSRAERAGLLDR